MPTHLKGEQTTMKANSKVANKSSEVDKCKDPYFKIKIIDFFKFMFDLEGFPVNIRKINKKEQEFLKSQGEPVDETIIYVVEKKGDGQP